MFGQCLQLPLTLLPLFCSCLPGTTKGSDFRETAPASSPSLGNQTTSLCCHPLPWRSHSEKGLQGWLQQEEIRQAWKNKDALHSLVTAAPLKGSRLISACRVAVAGAAPPFLPAPPSEPCPLLRLSPRTRLLQCKGPS